LKSILTLNFFLKSLIGLLLVSQLWVNAGSYCQWLIEDSSDLIEFFCCGGDNESEEKKDCKEKDNKVSVEYYNINTNISETSTKVFHHEYSSSTHDPEVTTPPPKLFLS